MRIVRVGCDVPESIRAAFDIKTTQDRKTMSQVLRAAIEAYLEGASVDFSDGWQIDMLSSAFAARRPSSEEE